MTDLTQKRDKLPAAFGMAQELSNLMPGNRFLAGLWESHLGEQLLWKSREPETRVESTPGPLKVATVLSDFHVPSWSWGLSASSHRHYQSFIKEGYSLGRCGHRRRHRVIVRPRASSEPFCLLQSSLSHRSAAEAFGNSPKRRQA